MHIELGGFQPEQDLEILRGPQGERIIKNTLDRFKTNFNIFAEHEVTRTLFSARIVYDSETGEKMFVVSLREKDYAVPYADLDFRFLELLQPSLDTQRSDNPINSLPPVLFANPQDQDKGTLKAYSALTLPAFISTYHLIPGWNNTKRAVAQVEIYDPDSGRSPLESWIAIAR